jgi:GNAT superfamily N-acetyltransferase
MHTPEISVVSQAERERVMATIMLGFSTDPLVRWFYPQAEEYVNSIPAFDAFCGGAVDHGTAFRTEAFEGAALWFPPGFGPDGERFSDYTGSTIREEILEDMAAVFDAMGDYHPDEPCWYLPVIGVDPAHQGKGLGAALMKHALQHIDEQALPAYLESSNPQNMSLYERHGFEAMGQIQIGSSPLITPMIRAARTP